MECSKLVAKLSVQPQEKIYDTHKIYVVYIEWFLMPALILQRILCT